MNWHLIDFPETVSGGIESCGMDGLGWGEVAWLEQACVKITEFGRDVKFG